MIEMRFESGRGNGRSKMPNDRVANWPTSPAVIIVLRIWGNAGANCWNARMASSETPGGSEERFELDDRGFNPPGAVDRFDLNAVQRAPGNVSDVHFGDTPEHLDLDAHGWINI